MRPLLLLLLLSASPARADVFDDASGLWGLPGDSELTCELNPHRVTFSADHARASFRWEGPMINYEGEVDQEGAYSVLDHGADYLVLALDGESRRSADGEPVVWIMRLLQGGARYCWGRTDWPEDECVDRYARCPAPTPTS
jgi:hypothetical protein